MKKSSLILLLILCLASSGLVQAQGDEVLPDLWVDLSMGAPLVDLFNERAQANDIARVEHISQLELLDDISTGRKLVVFKSAADAIRLLPHIHEEIDIVGYNLEHGPANPIFEQEHPVESIRQLREVTDSYGLELALGPDHRFALSDGAAMAPYADYFILQVQKVQTEPETVYDFVLPVISEIRAANSDIEISLQIRTEGNSDALLELLAPLEGEIQGISILTSEETLDVAEELVSTLRPERQLPTAEAPAPANGLEGESVVEPPVAAGLEQRPTAVAREREQTGGQVAAAEAPALSPPTEIVSVPEATERSGSTALFIVIALVVGFALGAGYISHRTGS